MLEGRVVDGRFALDALLGKGGVGTVYRARDLHDAGRPVAVKFLTIPSPRHVARLHREFRAIASLRHPHVVAALAFGQSEQGPYLAMELVDGLPFDDALRVGGARDGPVHPDAQPVPWLACRRALLQLFGTLADLHDRGFIHRDLKPGNVLIDGRGDVRILDFGLVRSRDESVELTSTGDVVGTVRYMAPEQLDGRRVDHRVDLFSAGVMAWQVLTGSHPFRAPGISSLVAQHRSGPRRRPRALAPGIPLSLEEVLLRLVAGDPGDRFASAAEVLRALREAGLLEGEDLRRVRPPADRALPLLPPVERPEAEAVLAEAAEHVLAGRARVVLVHGEAGVGKSWVLDRSLSRLRRMGFLTAGQPGACPLPGPGGAFGPVVNRMLAALAGPDPKEFGELVASLGPRPGSRSSSGSGGPEPRRNPAPTPADPRSRRIAAFEGFLRMVREAARVRGPLAIVLDELHRADRASLELADYLARACLDDEGGPPAVLLLVGAREASAGQPSLRPGRAGLARVALSPFGARELEEILTREPALPQERQGAARLLMRASDGLPGILAEVVEEWVRRGWVLRTARGLELTRRYHQEAIWAREEAGDGSQTGGSATTSWSRALRDALDSLPSDVRRIASRIAVLGPSVEFDLMAVAAGVSDWELLDAVTALVDGGILDEEAVSGSTRYRFRVARQAEFLAEEVDDDEGTRLHREAARWLAGEGRPGYADPGRVARHLAAAGLLTEAARWSLREARAARACQDRHGALRAFEAAAVTAREVGDAATRIEALRGICEECRALAMTEKGVRAAVEMREVAAWYGRPEDSWDAELLEAEIRLAAGADALAESKLRRLVADMSSLGRTEAEALLGLGRALAQRGELAEAATLFDRAAAAWASSGREAERVRALVNRAHVAYLQGDFREALRRFDEVQDFRGDVRVRATMLTNRAVVEGLAGDPSATTAMLDEAIDLYRGAGEQALLANAIAARLWTLPEVDSGMRDAIKEAVAFCRRAGLAPVLGNLYWGLARAGGEDGSVRSVQSLARRAYRQYSRARMRVQMCAIRLFLARVLAVDDPPRALRHAERALADLPADLAATLRWQVSATQALVREAAGREEEAADWMARAREELTAVLRSYVAEGATPEERAVQWSRPRDLVRIDEVLA